MIKSLTSPTRLLTHFPSGRYSFGADLALVGKPTASSSARGARPADATAGGGVGGWSPAAADAEPIFTVALHRPAPIDRVIVDMHSSGSIEGNARDFTISVEQRDGTWRPVAKVVGAFYNHTVDVQFATVQAVAVRLTVEVGNFGGREGGGVPAWWSPTTPLHIQLHSLSIYQSAPTDKPPAAARPFHLTLGSQRTLSHPRPIGLFTRPRGAA